MNSRENETVLGKGEIALYPNGDGGYTNVYTC